jgi:hypothetical protein
VTKSSISPAELAEAFARVKTLRADVERRERAIGRKAQQLARGLVDLMKAGDYLYRQTIGIHAFDVNGEVCLAAAYLEEVRGEYRYRYAVLCGGEAAKRALRTARLDPGDSDEPGTGRRIALATYSDHSDFIERLPGYIASVTREFEARVRQTDLAAGQIQDAKRQLSTLAGRGETGPQVSTTKHTGSQLPAAQSTPVPRPRGHRGVQRGQ